LLIIAVSGVPLAEAQIREVWYYSSWVTMVITAWMLAIMAAVFWWRNSIRSLKLPREPSHILAVMLMLTGEGNQVVEEYADYALIRGAERDRAARQRGNRYRGGWQRLQDGSDRWCVGVQVGVSS
jgi:hypothetical protein